MAKTYLNPDFLKQIFEYSPETGVLRWKRRADMAPWWNGRFAGKAVGRVDNGYARTSVCGQHVLVSQIVWAIMTNIWPDHWIDHKNRIRSDNRWKNLRRAEPFQNSANRPKFSTNTSGFKGVQPMGKYRWMARTTYKRKAIYLGSFDTKEEAYAAYCAFSKKLRGEFHHG